MLIISGEKRVLPFITGGAVSNGDLLVISSDKVVKAAAAASPATIVGIALDDAASGATVLVDVIGEGTVVSAPYDKGSKTSVTDADLGKLFDLTDEESVALDDTTGGICLCVGYDNSCDEIHFVITAADRYL